jgi:hypothetical protein
MSILDFPRIHFRGTARIHVPTGNNNNIGAIDIGTNTVYRDGEKVDLSQPPTEFHKYMREAAPRYNAAGEWDERGEFSKAAGWDFEGNSHFSWDARIVGTQVGPEETPSAAADPLVGRLIELWGHYNEYLGTTFNRARMVDCDPASNWATQVYAGQLTFGRKGPSLETPNIFSADIQCVQHSRFLHFDHIRELVPHCNNPEFAGAALFQFTVSKTDDAFNWGEEAEASPVLRALRKALEKPGVKGLVVQYVLYNMATTTRPDSPAFTDLVGTIGLWRQEELRTYPAGRLLAPKASLFKPRPGRPEAPKLGAALVQVSGGRVSFNMPITIPAVGRKPKLEASDGPTHPLGPPLALGTLELRVSGSDRLVARVPPEAYSWDAHHRTSGIIDVPLELGDGAVRDELERHGLYLTAELPGGARVVVLEEEELNIQTDSGNLYVEFPNPRKNALLAQCVEVRTFLRGRPAAVRDLHLHQFYNPRAVPHLRYEFEKDPRNAGRTFDFPRSDEFPIAYFKPGRPEDGGTYAPTCAFDTDEEGRGYVSIIGHRGGTTRVFMSPHAERHVFPLQGDLRNEAEYNYDNYDRIRCWGYLPSFHVRVLPDDWALEEVPDRDVDFTFLYQHVLGYYELIYPFMRSLVFSLADRCKCETYARLMWQMCDPKNKDKTYYMPPTRELSHPKSMLFLKYLRNVERIGYVPPPKAQKKTPHRKLESREQLVRALRDAVELELSLMLQYTYAAWSLPNHVTGCEYVERGLWTPEQLKLVCGDGAEALDQGWRGTILEVAHEEMAHFLVANNLLMALGEPFYVPTVDLSGANRFFPIDTEFALQPFSLGTLERFIEFEYPDYFEKEVVTPPELAAVPDVAGLPGLGTIPDLALDNGPGYSSVSELYHQIREAFETLPDLIVVERGKQGGEHHLFLHEAINRKHPDYQLQVDDVPSALFGVDFITQQGEGSSPDSPLYERSHFHRFRTIAQQLADQQTKHFQARRAPWNPAYPALRNPTLRGREGGGNRVTVAETRQVMAITEGCYELMLQLMVQHFGLMPRASLRRSDLMNASIDVMTGLLRPLGILLMTLPSGKKGRTAGPSFELDKAPAYIPVPQVAYKVISTKFRRLHELSLPLPSVSEAVKELLLFYSDYFARWAAKAA